jgi:hypothetical protein
MTSLEIYMMAKRAEDAASSGGALRTAGRLGASTVGSVGGMFGTEALLRRLDKILPAKIKPYSTPLLDVGLRMSPLVGATLGAHAVGGDGVGLRDRALASLAGSAATDVGGAAVFGFNPTGPGAMLLDAATSPFAATFGGKGIKALRNKFTNRARPR